MEYGDPGYTDTSGSAASTSGPSQGGGDIFSSVINGMFNWYGQKQANAANSAAAQKQMDFQERMSNTQYQRSTADMIAAGLNPMLLAGRASPAGTPPGAKADFKSTTEGVPGAAMTGAIMKATVDKLQAETNNVNADTKLKLEGTLPQQSAAAGQHAATTRNLDTRLQAFEDEWANIKQQYHNLRASAFRDTSGGLLSKKETEAIEYKLRNIMPQEAAKLAAEAKIAGYKVPEALQDAIFWSGEDASEAIRFRHAPKGLVQSATGLFQEGRERVRNQARQNPDFELRTGRR